MMPLPALRPLAARLLPLRTTMTIPALTRSLATEPPIRSSKPSIAIHPWDIHPTRRSTPGSFHGNVVLPPPRIIPVHPPPSPPPPKEPLRLLHAHHLLRLDPHSSKTRLLSRTRDGLRPGDILQIRFRHKDPFSGVLLQLRRRGVDSALLLRNQLTRIGVEMWVKLYSPNVIGVDVVQKSRRRARRARLYFMRRKEHDLGSVQGVVAAYVRQRALLRSGGAGRVGAATGAGKGAGAGAGGKKK